MTTEDAVGEFMAAQGRVGESGLAVPPPARHGGVPVRRRASRWLQLLWDDKVSFFGVVMLIVVILAAVFAPLVAPHGPETVDLTARLAPPVWSDGGSADHILGTDSLGRDVLSRLIYGARVSLSIGVVVVIISGIIGTLLGLLAGYKGGRWDTVIMRVADAQLAFPGLLLIIAVVAVVGPSIRILVIVLAVYGWMLFGRLVRGNVLQLREELYVRAATMSGAGAGRMMRRHFMPSLVSPLMTQSMLDLARVVLAEASLSYLGLGVQPPLTSWGLMVAENQTYLDEAWWTVVFPGLALALTVLATNLVASWLRIQTDPQQRQQVFALKRRRRKEVL
jgi:peptide/nickel transport system permease protein